MDDIILNKTAFIERCLNRIREDYIGYEAEFETNLLRQDAVILNLQRACEASIDLAAHVIRLKKLGLPQNSRDVFVLLQEATLIDSKQSQNLQRMVSFRNIAVHNYQELNLKLVRNLIEKRLVDFELFTAAMLSLVKL
jgi:uncharacterized protein YutE (UPF0331/DUF86 family)